MPETVHVDTEGRLEFCALLMEIVKAGWSVAISQAQPDGWFDVELMYLGPAAVGRAMLISAQSPSTLVALRTAWEKAAQAVSGATHRQLERGSWSDDDAPL